MERPSPSRINLRDLALLYVAMAQGADHHLETREVEAIADRLRVWEAGAEHSTVLNAIKEAMEVYTQDGLEQAVRAVREGAPQDARQAIMKDLVEIAGADNKFLFEEANFLGHLAEIWEVHLEGDERDDEGTWSILGGSRKKWSCLHDLMLIYVTLAHETDDNLSQDEIEAILQKIGEWMPDAQENELLGILQEVLAVYAQGQDRRVFTESVEAVKRDVPRHQLDAVLSDLRSVAEADGVLLDRERELIDKLSRAWEVG